MWTTRHYTLILCYLVASVVFGDAVSAAVGECDRVCTGIPRTCRYTFTMEWYWVLGAMTCGDCPHNVTHCGAAPTATHSYPCVSGNGVSRAALTVNRQIPGPAIVVCEGDTIAVTVRNHMEDAAGTSIHWHGQHMRGHQHMDGVGLVTQCNIGYQEEFQYQFPAEQSGTYFWHAHSGLQRSDGVFGPLVVRDTVGADPNSALYDHDLTEHVVIINDWSDTMTTIAFSDMFFGQGVSQPMTSALINGKGVYRAVPDLVSGRSSLTPREVFSVTRGQRYRFRVISATTACVFTIFVQGHNNLTLIATDGHAIRPRSVGSFQILSGERYDFVLHADRTVGNYWLYARGDGLECGGDPTEPISTKTQQAAIIRYRGAPEIEPTTPALWDYMIPNPPIVNPYPQFGVPGAISISDLTSSRSELLDKWVADIQGEPDVRFYIGAGTEPITFTHPRWTNDMLPFALNINGELHRPMLNGITFKFPSSPILTQPEDIDDSLLCNADHLPDDCPEGDFCYCHHKLSVALGDLVEIIFVDENHINENHPLHLHGYSFAVIGQGEHNLTDPHTRDLEIVSGLQTYDEKYGLPRNLEHPPFKDTVSIPLKGYTILRFRADNPGYWFMHCHVEFHASSGMALVLQVGENSDLPKLPENFPRCGSYTAGAAAAALVGTSLLCYVIGILSILTLQSRV